MLVSTCYERCNTAVTQVEEEIVYIHSAMLHALPNCIKKRSLSTINLDKLVHITDEAIINNYYTSYLYVQNQRLTGNKVECVALRSSSL